MLSEFARCNAHCLAPAEEGVGCFGNLGGGQVVTNGQRQFVNNLGGMWRNDGGTNQNTLFIGNQFDKPIAEVAGVAARHPTPGRDGLPDP